MTHIRDLTFDDEFFFSNLQQNFQILKKILIFESKFYYEHIFAVRNFSHIFSFHQNLQKIFLISHFHFIDSFYNVGKILEFSPFFLILLK